MFKGELFRVDSNWITFQICEGSDNAFESDLSCANRCVIVARVEKGHFSSILNVLMQSSV